MEIHTKVNRSPGRRYPRHAGEAAAAANYAIEDWRHPCAIACTNTLVQVTKKCHFLMNRSEVRWVELLIDNSCCVYQLFCAISVRLARYR